MKQTALICFAFIFTVVCLLEFTFLNNRNFSDILWILHFWKLKSVITMMLIVIYCMSPELILNLPFLAGKAAKYPRSSIPIALWCKAWCIVGGGNLIPDTGAPEGGRSRHVIGKFILIKWQLHHQAAAPPSTLPLWLQGHLHRTTHADALRQKNTPVTWFLTSAYHTAVVLKPAALFPAACPFPSRIFTRRLSLLLHPPSRKSTQHEFNPQNTKDYPTTACTLLDIAVKRGFIRADEKVEIHIIGSLKYSRLT